MWLPGHLALSALAVLPVIEAIASKRSVNRIQVLAFLFFFSVFPDFLHIGELRILTHSLLGLSLSVAIITLLIWKLVGIDRILLSITIVASGLHLLGDWIFGHFYPLFPFSTQYFSINNFNTLLNMRTELLLFILVLPFIFLVLKKAYRDTNSISYPPKQRHIALVMVSAFMLMGTVQTILFFGMSVQHAPTLTSISLFITYPIILFLSILIAIAISKKGFL
ncbi:MAG: hypothetical protein ACPLM9_05310 [Methanomassiliicoccales archaeon]|jgi:hypothetical protein